MAYTDHTDLERVMLKSDVEQLLLNLRTESPDWGSMDLARSLVHIQNDFDLDLDDYISNDMMDYVHMYLVYETVI